MEPEGDQRKSQWTQVRQNKLQITQVVSRVEENTLTRTTQKKTQSKHAGRLNSKMCACTV